MWGYFMGSDRNRKGQFVPGNRAAVGNQGGRPRKGMGIPCPPQVAAWGVSGTWDTLSCAAANDPRAAMQLIDLAARYGLIREPSADSGPRASALLVES